jgi:hypothetical protein
MIPKHHAFERGESANLSKKAPSENVEAVTILSVNSISSVMLALFVLFARVFDLPFLF